ncbi:MAG TPA: TMEM165/GDT1 family protein [Stellaceae bacterium]|jgi:putative Ca2+/H+ antiporter (TMEM165/GDT1 family)|nr:TMEM165/GDT1 family protein [Stellaceae bacterium]
MEAFLVSFGLVALAELGDKTQLLALMLASRFHRPVPILAGILVAVVLNHATAALLGYFVGIKLNGPWMRYIIAASFFAVALWAVLPEKPEDERPEPSHLGVFGATLCTFFIAELGDKTQIATAALAARFHVWVPVLIGTTAAMMAANVPAVLLGRQLSRWVSLSALRWGAVAISVAMGIATLMSAE